MTKDEIRKAMGSLSKQLRDIEVKDRVARSSLLLGKCFKTQNNYSGASKPEDYWWIYTRVERMDNDGYLWGTSFEIDCNGKVEIETNDVTRVESQATAWVEIPREEFDLHAAELQAFVANHLNKRA
jgi:hypothetical protein